MQWRTTNIWEGRACKLREVAPRSPSMRRKIPPRDEGLPMPGCEASSAKSSSRAAIRGAGTASTPNVAGGRAVHARLDPRSVRSQTPSISDRSGKHMSEATRARPHHGSRAPRMILSSQRGRAPTRKSRDSLQRELERLGRGDARQGVLQRFPNRHHGAPSLSIGREIARQRTTPEASRSRCASNALRSVCMLVGGQHPRRWRHRRSSAQCRERDAPLRKAAGATAGDDHSTQGRREVHMEAAAVSAHGQHGPVAKLGGVAGLSLQRGRRRCRRAAVPRRHQPTLRARYYVGNILPTAQALAMSSAAAATPVEGDEGRWAAPKW